MFLLSHIIPVSNGGGGKRTIAGGLVNYEERVVWWVAIASELLKTAGSIRCRSSQNQGTKLTTKHSSTRCYRHFNVHTLETSLFTSWVLILVLTAACLLSNFLVVPAVFLPLDDGYPVAGQPATHRESRHISPFSPFFLHPIPTAFLFHHSNCILHFWNFAYSESPILSSCCPTSSLFA